MAIIAETAQAGAAGAAGKDGKDGKAGAPHEYSSTLGVSTCSTPWVPVSTRRAGMPGAAGAPGAPGAPGEPGHDGAHLVLSGARPKREWLSGNRPKWERAVRGTGWYRTTGAYAWALMLFVALLNIAVLLATVRSEQQ
jgi:hypothetical protein